MIELKEAFVFGRVLRLCSSSLIFLFDGHFMTVFQSDIFKGKKHENGSNVL